MRRPLAWLALAVIAASPAAAAISCDDPASIVQALQAALGQFKSSNACGQEAALARLNELFKDGLPAERAKTVVYNGDADPGPYRKPEKAAKETVPISPAILDAAVAHISARLNDGTIKTACTRDDVSADWDSHAVDECPYSVCGKIELGRRWAAKVQSSSFATEMELRDADQVANSLTHELVHVLVTYFRRVYGAKDQDNVSGGLRSDFQYFTFFNGCSLMQVNGTGREHSPIAYVAPNDMYDPGRAGNEQTARTVAHALQFCFNRKPNPYYAAILGAQGVSTCSP